MRKPDILLSSYIMVVSGKKSHLELKGLRSASALRKQGSLPPSLQSQGCRMGFCGFPTQFITASTLSISLPAVREQGGAGQGSEGPGSRGLLTQHV